MSEWKDKLLYPPIYLLFLLAAVFFIYRAFTVGLERGEYVGKYDPHVEVAPPQEEEQEFDLRELMQPTDELVSLGQELYNINCASCHGQEGRGNGPKAAGLSPPPRSFSGTPSDQWTNGAGPLQIYQTLTNGVPGTSMASFSFLNERERMALAHYVRTFVPDPPDDPQQLVQELAPAQAGAPAAPQPPAGADTAAGDTAADTVPAKGPSLPVEFAIERMLAERRPATGGLDYVPAAFTRHCASCHGDRGQGAVVERNFPPVGTVYLQTESLTDIPQQVVADRQAFQRFLSWGIPGVPGHKFPELTPAEVDSVYRALTQPSGR